MTVDDDDQAWWHMAWRYRWTQFFSTVTFAEHAADFLMEVFREDI